MILFTASLEAEATAARDTVVITLDRFHVKMGEEPAWYIQGKKDPLGCYIRFKEFKLSVIEQVYHDNGKREGWEPEKVLGVVITDRVRDREDRFKHH